MTLADSPRRNAAPKVLVVDNDSTMLLGVQALLCPTTQVRTCDKAELAFRVLETWDADVVCADYALPGITGLELLRQVAPPTGARQGVLITGNEELLGVAQRHGYFAVLKPFDSLGFLNTVHQLGRLATACRAGRARPSTESLPRPASAVSGTRLRLTLDGDGPVGESPAQDVRPFKINR